MKTKATVSTPCKDACFICDKSQYHECTLWEKLRLGFHILYCNTCRNYLKTNKKLTLLIKNAKINCLDKKNKDILNMNFQKALKNHEIN